MFRARLVQDLRTCCALNIVLGVVVVLMVPMLGV